MRISYGSSDVCSSDLRRTKVEAGQSDSRQGTGRLALLRLVAAIFVAFTLSFMPMAMSSGPAMAHTTPVVLSDTRHCIGEHGTSPDRQMGGMVDCAIACAAVRPTRSEEHTSELRSLMRISYDV